MTSIPASKYANVTPGILSAGGTAKQFIGLFLTTNPRTPFGPILSFPSYLAVAAYFGSSSVEAIAANYYFQGFDNSNKKPASLLFYFAPINPSSAFVRGAPPPSLAAVQGVASGTLNVTIDGILKSSSAVNLSTASSFTAAAALLSTQLGAAITYDSISGTFVISSAIAGASSTVSAVTGNCTGALGLNVANGTILSQGSAVMTGTAVMNAIVNQTQNWGPFTTLFTSTTGFKTSLASWTNGQGSNYMFVYHSMDITDTQLGVNTSDTYNITQNGYAGCFPIYAPVNLWNASAFVCGAAASIDFSETAGRITLAYKTQSGLAPDVTDQTTANNLEANGLNYYGIAATDNNPYVFLYPGTITGPFKFADSYINQAWLSGSFQVDLMQLLTQVKSIPYNATGGALIKSALADTIQQGLDFGAFSAGVTLSYAQIQILKTAAGGQDISGTLFNQGWFLLVQTATPQVRTARGSPPCTFWYADAGSIQQINLASIEVQ